MWYKEEELIALGTKTIPILDSFLATAEGKQESSKAL